MILFHDQSSMNGDSNVTWFVVIVSTLTVSVMYPNSILSHKLFIKSISPLEDHFANHKKRIVLSNQIIKCDFFIVKYMNM